DGHDEHKEDVEVEQRHSPVLRTFATSPPLQEIRIGISTFHSPLRYSLVFPLQCAPIDLLLAQELIRNVVNVSLPHNRLFPINSPHQTQPNHYHHQARQHFLAACHCRSPC